MHPRRPHSPLAGLVDELHVVMILGPTGPLAIESHVIISALDAGANFLDRACRSAPSEGEDAVADGVGGYSDATCRGRGWLGGSS
jgi:hypothetical protein